MQSLYLYLLAFAKAWTNVQKEPQKNKLLIVDSDIEAPGLTWSYSGNLEDCFSYLDLLTLIQDSDQIDEVVEIATQGIGVLTIPIETNQEIVEEEAVVICPVDPYVEDDYFKTIEALGKSVMLLRPLTCHIPVSPGLVARRAR